MRLETLIKQRKENQELVTSSLEELRKKPKEKTPRTDLHDQAVILLRGQSLN